MKGWRDLRVPIFLFAALLTTDVSVLVFEKIGAAAAGDAVGNELSFYLKLACLPWTWAVIVLSPIQLVIWSKILSKTDLSLAYPVSSLCFPFTMIASFFVFNDKVSPEAMLGALLITLGIAVVTGEKEVETSPLADGIKPEELNEKEQLALSSSKGSSHETSTILKSKN